MLKPSTKEFHAPMIIAMLSEAEIKDSVIWACEQEVNAPKPGNVNCFSDGHNMEKQDFIASAHAIAAVMAQPGLTVGQRILKSIEATRQVVDCNTNLGIVLLFAPLCQAIQQTTQADQIETQLTQVLSRLTINDAELAYQAIRLAQAGGLGNATEQDINDQPNVSLLAAMKLAEDYDTIAQQYSNNYREICQLTLPAFTEALTQGESVEWACAFAYLKLLSEVPDSLIHRKQSDEHAQAVLHRAKQFVFKMNKSNKLEALQSELAAWDNELKQEAINPGTSADLIAATLLLYQFVQRLSVNRISVP